MKRGVLVAVFFILAMLLSCSPKESIKLPPTQETTLPAATETPASPPSSEAQETAIPTPSPAPQETQTPNFSPTSPSQTTARTTTPIIPLPPLDDFMKGFNFADWAPLKTPLLPADQIPGKAPPLRVGLYTPPAADQSLKNLAATGTNWISLVVEVFQETILSMQISIGLPRTATDSELQRMIDLAHSLGMRVLLMPLLHLSNDPNHWWGEIGTAFTSEAQWQEWFASYREFINYYANFSTETGVDVLSIGNELGGTTHRENDWRLIIQEVRQRFKGPITYASLCGTFPFPQSEDERIKWWDALDYIGMQPYYRLTEKNDPTVEELKAAWTERGYLALMENLSKKFNKPVIAIEFGYRSIDGANKLPAGGNIEAPIDLQEQADCYQAALEVLWGKPWLAGIFWWQWFANPAVSPGGPNDDSMTPYGKPAEEVLKKFYLSK